MFGRRAFSALLVLASLLGACGGCGADAKPEAWIEDGTPAAEKQPDFVTDWAKEFFVKWLADHGEEAIVTDEQGVGIEGNATRLAAFHYGTNDIGNGCTVETEFRITLPDGREIVEFVGGNGETQDTAVNMTFVNFTLSTFHVVYSCFMNTNDPHMTHEPMTAGGKAWTLTTGGMIALGSDEVPDLSDVGKACLDELADLKLSDRAHWLKFVYGRHQEEVLSSAVTLDNEEEKFLTSRLEGLPWPPTETYYIAKQFIVLRPAATAAGSDSAGE